MEVDPRDEQNLKQHRAQLKRAFDPEEDKVFGLFMRFFPLNFFVDRLQDVADHYNSVPGRNRVSWTKGTFLRFLGVLIHFAVSSVPNMEWHWRWPDDVPSHAAPTFAVAAIMSEHTFKRYWQYITMPGLMGVVSEEEEPAGRSEDVRPELYRQSKAMLAACVKAWQKAWTPGTYITIDESMVMWTGKGDLHLTYMPRKPTSLGFKIDTLCDGVHNICLAAELDEGAEAMAGAKFRDQVGASVAVTLRLAEAWANTDRTIIADSRFGSCNCAEWVWDELHLHSIMAVKTAHAGYPKKKLAEALGGERGATKCFKVEVEMDRELMTFYASALMDKKPMYVVATCGTTNITHTAKRVSRRARGNRGAYDLEFPEMHALYRSYFNAVDLFNRDCFGVLSVQMAIQTKSYYRRWFLAMLGMCETNAMNAYRATVGPLSRYQWLTNLSKTLIYNDFVNDSDCGVEPEVEASISVHSNLHYVNHALKCSACKRLTHWRCGCRLALCSPGTSAKLQRKACYFNHIKEAALEEAGILEGAYGTQGTQNTDL